MANILGININSLERREISARLLEALDGNKRCFIVTPNPEIILLAHKDEELFYILNRADLSLADGFGLKIAAFLYQEKITRLTGADFAVDLLNLAHQKKRRVAVVNWRGGLSGKEEISVALSQKYPGLEFLVLDVSRSASLAGWPAWVIAGLKEFSSEIVFCTFGSPYQEKSVYHSLPQLPEVKVALSCGGAFDFITGKLTRAPLFFRKIGLEWLWRLYQQPARFKRIVNAVLVFSAKVMAARFFYKHRYRKNVACLLFKQEQSGKKILIVERSDNPGYWQLPQGGLDGESIELAGARELREETGVTSISKKGFFKDVYTYNFPSFNSQQKHVAGYKGQRQSLFIAEFTGPETEIKINFWDHSNWQWVREEDLISAVHEIRRPGIKIFLDKLKSLNL